MTVTINGSGPVTGVTSLGMTSGTITGLSAGGLPDGSVTQPDLATPVAGNGPAFSAGKSSAQSVSSAIFTKIVFDVKAFDTNTNYNASTGTFTPTVAGYYQFNVSVGFSSQTSQSIAINLYKNGSTNLYVGLSSVNANGAQIAGSGLIYCNGSTDYVEVYGWQNSGGALNVGTNSYFQGYLVRAA